MTSKRRPKAFAAINAGIAIHKPIIVVLSARPTPRVRVWESGRPCSGKSVARPVTVPSRPNKGAAATMLSSRCSPRCKRTSSLRAHAFRTSPLAPSFQRCTMRPAADSPDSTPTWLAWPLSTALKIDVGMTLTARKANNRSTIRKTTAREQNESGQMKRPAPWRRVCTHQKSLLQTRLASLLYYMTDIII